MSRLFSLSLLLLLAACGGGGDPGVANAPENEPPVVRPAESFTLSFEPVLYPRDTVLLADGSLVWFNDLGGPAHPERLLETDDALYVAIDQQIGTITLDGVDYSSAFADSFLVSLRKDGSYRWVRAIEHSYSDLIGGLAERWDGWILLAGTVGVSAQFRGTTAGQDRLLDEHGGFVALYDPSGDLLNVLPIEVGDGIRLEHLLVRDDSAWFSGVQTGSVRFSEGPELPAPPRSTRPSWSISS